MVVLVAAAAVCLIGGAARLKVPGPLRDAPNENIRRLTDDLGAIQLVSVPLGPALISRASLGVNKRAKG